MSLKSYEEITFFVSHTCKPKLSPVHPISIISNTDFKEMDQQRKNQMEMKRNVQKNFQILRGLVADNERMICDVVENFEEVINDDKMEGCKSINQTLLNMTESAIDSAKITKTVWSKFVPLLKSTKEAYDCKYYISLKKKIQLLLTSIYHHLMSLFLLIIICLFFQCVKRERNSAVLHVEKCAPKQKLRQIAERQLLKKKKLFPMMMCSKWNYNDNYASRNKLVWCYWNIDIFPSFFGL